MRGRLLHTINSLALSVTCGDPSPLGELLSLRDIFAGEVFLTLSKEMKFAGRGLSLWESWQIQRI